MFKPEPEIAEKERLGSSFQLKEVAEDKSAPAFAPTGMPEAPEAPEAAKTYPESPPSLDARYEILDYQLASTYSGNNENSMQLWKQTTTKTIAFLREWIDQPLPTFPYFIAVINRTSLIDKIQEVAQDCLDHRQPELADNVMQMDKDLWKYEDGVQMQRNSELYRRLNSQKFEKSE